MAGLMEQWALQQPAKSPSGKEAEEVRSALKRELAAISVCVADTVGLLDRSEHSKIAARATKAFEAYQKICRQLEKTSPDKRQSLAEAFAGKLAKLREGLETTREHAAQSYQAWDRATADYDAVSKKLDEMRDSDDDQVQGLFRLDHDIQASVAIRDWIGAKEKLEGLKKAAEIAAKILKEMAEATKPKTEKKGKQEFKTYAYAQLFADGSMIEVVNLISGTGELTKLQTGAAHQVKVVVDARFSHPAGPKAAPVFKGHKFGLTFEGTWDLVVTKDNKIRIKGKPKEKTKDRLLAPGDSVDFDSGDRGESVFVTVKYDLGVDLPLLPKPKKFQKDYTCFLKASDHRIELTPHKLVVGSFKFDDDEVANVKPISGMIGYNELKAFIKALPSATLAKIKANEPPGGSKIEIYGYADNKGGEAYNDGLSDRRAMNVMKMFQRGTGNRTNDIYHVEPKGEDEVKQDEKREEKKDPKQRKVEVLMMLERDK